MWERMYGMLTLKMNPGGMTERLSTDYNRDTIYH